MAVLLASAAFATRHTVSVAALGSGTGTLYHAITGSSAGDTIVFSSCLAGDTISTYSNPIDHALVILGSGQQQTFFDCRSNNTFKVNSGGNLMVSGITFLGYDRTGGEYGAITVKTGGAATISNCRFDNSSGGLVGRHAIFTAAGTPVSVTGCSAYYGGLVYAQGSVVISNCSVRKTDGSAIHTFDTTDSLIVSGCTIDSCTTSSLALVNHAAVFASFTACVFKDNALLNVSAINATWQSDSMYVTNCSFVNNTTTGSTLLYIETDRARWTSNTIAGNTSGTSGILYMRAQKHYLTNNTIVNNNVGNTNNALVEATSVSTLVYLYNNIIFGNGGNDVHVPFLEADVQNIVGACSCANTFYSSSDPMLDAGGIADNGGTVPTFGVQAGSSAIDQANATHAPATDARNFGRTGAADIGAFEYNGAAACAEPVLYGISVTDFSPGGTATIEVNGALNDATYWQLYTASCGGTAVGSSASGSFTVSPTGTTTYYARGEGGCVVPGACLAATTNQGAGPAVSITVDQLPTNCDLTGGALTASATGGTPGYTYAWSTGGATAAITGLGETTYTVSVTDGAACTAVKQHTFAIACDAPTGFKVQYVQDTSALFKWEPVCGAVLYKFYYKALSPVPTGWISVPKLTAQIDVATLQPATTYRWTVQTKCGAGDWSELAPYQTFSTLANPCFIPDSLSTSSVQVDKARLNWNMQPDVLKYRIRWREQGGSWTVELKDNTWSKHWLTGLSASTTYEWQVKSLCEPSLLTTGTQWSATQSFTTPASKWDNNTSANTDDGQGTMHLFPNPAAGQVQVAIEMPHEQTVELVLLDAVGRTVCHQTVAVSYQRLVSLDLAAFAAGMYHVRVSGEAGVLIKPLVIQ